MKISFGNNVASLQVQRRLSASTEDLRSTFERLSSGLRINSAGDDAAGLAIADTLKADARVYTQGIRNFNDGLSLLAIADSALEQLGEITTRLGELAEQAANGAYSAVQRRALDAEAQALSKEFGRITTTTEFNDLSLLSGTLSELKLQGGYGLNSGIVSNLGGAIGSGTFGTATTYTLNGFTSDLATADINGDGIPDIVTAESSNGVSYRYGLGDGTFGSATALTMSIVQVNGVALGDLNNDGRLDIVAGGTGGGDVAVRFGNGNGTFGAAVSYVISGTTNSAISLGDLNNDGNLDLVIGSTDSVTVRTALGDGTGNFSSVLSYTVGSTLNALVLGDLNGDGLLDMALSGSANTEFRFGLGTGALGASTILANSTTTADGLAFGDFNGDGQTDMVVGGGNHIDVFMNQGGGSFATRATYFSFNSNGGSVTVGDFNGDGVQDIAEVGTGAVSIFRGIGNGTFAAATSYTVGSSNHTIATRDANLDGVPDLIIGQSAGTGQAMVLLGNSISGTHQLLPFSLQTKADALQALPIFQRKRELISIQRGKIGAFQSRVIAGENALTFARDNAQIAESQIRDADIAQEAASLVRSQILQKSGLAVLAQANLEPKLALTLITGKKS